MGHVVGFVSERTPDGFIAEVFCVAHGKNLPWLHYQPIWSDDYKGLDHSVRCDKCEVLLADAIAPAAGATNQNETDAVNIYVPVGTRASGLARLLLDHPNHRVARIQASPEFNRTYIRLERGGK